MGAKESEKSSNPGNHLEPDERKIITILSKGPTTVASLAEALKTSEQDVVLALDNLWKKGFQIRHIRQTKQVSLVKAPEKLAPLVIEVGEETERPVTGEIAVGVLYGTAAGSRYAKWRCLATVLKAFEAANVSFAIHLGDWIRGIPPQEREDEVIPELARPTLQADFVAQYYPRMPFKTYGISGPYDLSARKPRELRGFKALRYISEGRRALAEDGEADIIYRGDLSASFMVKKLGIKRGVLIKAQNLGEKRAYAVTYPLQGVVETIAGALPTLASEELEYDALVVLTAAGGVTDHLPEYNLRGRVHAYSVPILQGITPYQERRFRRGAAPTLGAGILRIRYNPDTWELLDDGIIFETINLTDYQGEDDWKEGAFTLAESKGLTLSAEETKILTRLAKGDASLGELSRLRIGRKGIGKTRVQEAVTHLQELGYTILTPEDPDQRASNTYGLVLGVRSYFPPFNLDEVFAKDTTVAIVTDTHFASKWQLPSLVVRAFGYARERGAKAILLPGDGTDGVPGAGGGRAREKKAFIVEGRNQVLYMAEHLPSGEGFEHGIIVVDGDHDLWSWALAGWDPMEELALRRSDVHYIGNELEGQLSGFVEIDGIAFELLHMTGGVGYALSYQGQKRVEAEIREAYTRLKNKILQVLVIGGGHVANMMLYKGIVVVHGGGFQARTPDYMTPKGLTPWVGTMILTLTQDAKGRITKVTSSYLNLAPYIKLPDRPELR